MGPTAQRAVERDHRHLACWHLLEGQVGCGDSGRGDRGPDGRNIPVRVRRRESAHEYVPREFVDQFKFGRPRVRRRVGDALGDGARREPANFDLGGHGEGLGIQRAERNLEGERTDHRRKDCERTYHCGAALDNSVEHIRRTVALEAARVLAVTGLGRSLPSRGAQCDA